jgi:methionyl aminopeptidase
MPISIKNDKDIAKMQEAGHVVSVCHQRVEPAIRPGVTTGELDAIVVDTLKEFGALANFLGYNGFPSSICASTNNEIVHGFPGKRVLKEGDIVSLDCGAIVDGWHADSAWTYPVGDISEDASRLLKDTEEALWVGVRAARAGSRLGEIGHAVESYAAPRGYGIVRGYGGHGIGRRLHEDPHVPNYGERTWGPRLIKGMTLCVEPMLTLGTDDTRVLEDDWTVVTRDSSLSAHFEFTIAITDDEPLILTPRLAAVVE